MTASRGRAMSSPRGSRQDGLTTPSARPIHSLMSQWPLVLCSSACIARARLSVAVNQAQAGSSKSLRTVTRLNQVRFPRTAEAFRAGTTIFVATRAAASSPGASCSRPFTSWLSEPRDERPG